jgi:hypothetical protein
MMIQPGVTPPATRSTSAGAAPPTYDELTFEGWLDRIPSNEETPERLWEVI